MSRIRVLRVISHLDLGGIQRQMLRQCTVLKGLGVDTEVCCVDKMGRIAEEFESRGMPVHFIRFRSRLDPVALVRMRLLAWRGRFDIVHAHMYNANVAVNWALRGAKARIVNGYHNQIFVKTERQTERVRRTRNTPAAFVAVAENIREALVQTVAIPADRITVIHNGIEAPAEPAPLPVRKPGDPLELLWAGRFVNQKRLHHLVGVVAVLRDRGIPARLTLLGDGPAVNDVRARMKERKADDLVRLPGFVDDVFPFLRECDLFVSASYREGFSNVLLEACAAGRGMILSDIAPHRELTGSTTAGIYPGDNADQWADAIAPLAEDRARLEAMGAEAHRLALQFSIEAAARKAFELYVRITGKRPTPA